MRSTFAALAILLLSACQDTWYDEGGGYDPNLPIPTGLLYTVEPVGTGNAPSGILLSWNNTTHPEVAGWRVYSRASTGVAFSYRGSTTSPSFHDAGAPYLQYYVVTVDVDGYESDESSVITIDERLALARPSTLNSVSLDRAVALAWSDNAYAGDPAAFSHYRVYGASYDLDAGICEDNWGLEGTTVAPEFVAAALSNGVPRCFAVTAVSIEGYESLWSPLKDDTPRPDARNVLVWARQEQDAGSALRFWQDLDVDGFADGNELGLLKSGLSATADFSVERDVNGALWLQPRRTGTTLAIYGALPVEDLTSIDWAPINGYAASAAEAVPGWGYVFQTDGGDGFARYGAVRVTHVGQDYLILDWAFQTDRGNPELVAKR